MERGDACLPACLPVLAVMYRYLQYIIIFFSGVRILVRCDYGGTLKNIVGVMESIPPMLLYTFSLTGQSECV